MDATVTIKPSLTLNIPTNTITMNLDPANHDFDEQDLTISVGTNNPTGYQLTANTLGNTNTLVNTADSTKTIPTLSSSFAPADFPANYWGIRKTAGTTSSGNYSGFTAPYTVASSNVPVNNDQTTLGFASKVDYTKPSGLYELNLEFKALPIVTTNYMQDIASDPTLADTVCTNEPTVVVDKRDEQSYTIRRIGGDCWMVENLNFIGVPSDPKGTMTLNSNTSNVQNNITLTYYDFSTEGGVGGDCYADTISGGGFVNPCILEGSSIGNRSVWYNFAAATAGTIAGNLNASPQLYDVCPAGWRMPNTTEANNVISYATEFNPVVGGAWYDGGLQNINVGYYWSSNAHSDKARLFFNSNLSSGNTGTRRVGMYVRCVMKNTNINNLTYMQDFAVLNESSNTAKKQQVINSMELNVASYALSDSRDNKNYTIKKIGPANDQSKQNIWMTDNLLFQNTTLSPDNSDVTVTRTLNSGTYSGYSLNGSDAASASSNCYGNYSSTNPASSSGNGFVNACMYYIASDSNIGGKPNAWYNYAAATAGTINNPGGTSVSGESTESICPKGWKLPNLSLASTIADNTSTYIDIFNTFYGGYYNNGSNPTETGVGGWWITTKTDQAAQYAIARIQASPYTNLLLTSNFGPRYRGYYIRCLAR